MKLLHKSTPFLDPYNSHNQPVGDPNYYFAEKSGHESWAKRYAQQWLRHARYMLYNDKNLVAKEWCIRHVIP